MPVARISSMTEDLVDDLGREAHRGLVHEQHLRACHEGPGDRQHLLLAAREGAGGQAPAVTQDREAVVGLRERLLGRTADVPAAEVEVLLDGERAEDLAALRHLDQALADESMGRGFA